MRAVATAAGVFALELAVLVTSRAAAAAHSRAPSPAAAKTAFGRLLHHLYGEIHGYWTCPYQYPPGPSDSCLGEVHPGRRWHAVGADARSNHGEIVFEGVFAQTWTRHCSRYSQRSIAPNPGVVWVNSSAYGWGFLASGVAHLKDGAHTDLLGKGKLITCRNSLGDAMRYRRKG